MWFIEPLRFIDLKEKNDSNESRGSLVDRQYICGLFLLSKLLLEEKMSLKQLDVNNKKHKRLFVC